MNNAYNSDFLHKLKNSWAKCDKCYCLHASNSRSNYLLDHIEDGFVFPQPYVVVWNGHGLEGNVFGILEEGIGTPDFGQPLDWKQPVLGSHVFRQSKPRVLPTLGKEDITCVSLKLRGKDKSLLDTFIQNWRGLKV